MLTLDLARESSIKDTLFLDAMFADGRDSLPKVAAVAEQQVERRGRYPVEELTRVYLRLKCWRIISFGRKVCQEPQTAAKTLSCFLAQRGVMLKTIEPVYLRALMDMVEFGVIAPAALQSGQN